MKITLGIFVSLIILCILYIVSCIKNGAVYEGNTLDDHDDYFEGFIRDNKIKK